MKPVRMSCLFGTQTQMTMPELAEHMAACLHQWGITDLRPIDHEDKDALAFACAGFRLDIASLNHPKSIEQFDRSLDSIISNAQRDALAKTLFEHVSRIEMVLTPTPGEGVYLPAKARMRLLEAAHAICAIVTGATKPDAVHWLHSDQLLTGEQFLTIEQETSPLPLFAAGYKEGASVRIQVPEDLAARDIMVDFGKEDPNLAYATGLAFLRHFIETGHALPDGDTYGPVHETQVEVRHVDLSAPDGRPCYELRMRQMADGVTERLNPGNANALSAIQSRLREIAGKTNRPISKAIFSTVM